MDYLYRQLSPSDVSVMKKLQGVFGEAFGDRAAYQDQVPRDEYLQSLLSKDHFIALVCQTNNTVVGGLAAYVLEKFEQERKEIYIYDLAVLEEHRRRGIASGLIKELQKTGKAIGAYVIYVQADKGEEDKPAIALYESLGTKEDVYHFDIPV